MRETLFFHVTGRGNVRREIFLDHRDYSTFLRYLSVAIERYGWRCHSYCLIPNHYHSLLEIDPSTLGRGMLVVAGSYARYFNHRYETNGHVFQGPYSAEPVIRETHLLEVFRYIAMNPVRAGLCERPEDWAGYTYFCNPVATMLQPGC